MIGVPPFRGELGILLRYHAVAVRAMPRPVMVAHEPGLEALYPDAKRILVRPKPDRKRRWLYRHDEEFVALFRAKFAGLGFEVREPGKGTGDPIEVFEPEPTVEQIGDEEIDVVVCPRFREYGTAKNWDAWPEVSGLLMGSGARVFAAGKQESSYDVPSDDASWRYARPLDATIEAMRRAKVVLATASGLSLLALLCRAPRLVLVAANGGKVAPGAAVDGAGRVAHETYWEVPIERYYDPLNRGTEIELLRNGWDRPEAVAEIALPKETR